MASLVDLKVHCDTPGCLKRAVVEVKDRWNGSRGTYCRTCGQRLVKRLTQQGV